MLHNFMSKRTEVHESQEHADLSCTFSLMAHFLDTMAVLLLLSDCKLSGGWDRYFSPACTVKHVQGAVGIIGAQLKASACGR